MTTKDRTDAAPASEAEPADDHRYTARLADVIETRWQRAWRERDVYRCAGPGHADFDPAKPKFYCLDMFPYPSGAGLHVGHPVGYIGTDIICRYKRQRGFNVLHPMGWDAFGLPAEQYAIQTGVHPAETTRKAIDNFRRQLSRLGFCYDWNREFATIDPEYYRWTQWIWLKAYGAWYDAAADGARPIGELEQGLADGAIVLDAQRRAVRAGHANAAAAGPKWSSLDADAQRRVIDDHRLAYLGEQTVNWCPALGTALANEEVIDGRSERGSHPVFRKPLRQWMFRITAYADRLLNDLDGLDWPESTRAMQKEWIGRSEGAEIDFVIDAPPAGAPESLRVFTTRPDTLFGATYMVVAPEHPLVDAVLHSPAPGTDVAALRAYTHAARNRSDVDRQADTKEKTGVATGLHARNPATGELVPIWTSDYVLMGYGHGAIMAVPGHDARDYEFAQRFELPIRIVVTPPPDTAVPEGEAYCGHGTACASASDELSIDGLSTDEAKAAVIRWLTASGRGQRRINYRLRDWLFSRQRYWGEPFPIVYTRDGHHHPVSDAALPVLLPPLTDYQPVVSDDPVPLLAKVTDWVETTAGEAGVDPAVLPPETPVRRETNTMPGWAGSCWYFLRYLDPRNTERFVSRDAEQYWMRSLKKNASESAAPGDDRTFDPARHHKGGVDLYVGGAEHATLHLLYARFWHKILFDLGEVSTPEPFGRLFHQGLLTAYAYQREDRTLVPVDEVSKHDDGTFTETVNGAVVTPVVAKMSKALRNVVNPDDIIREYGADTFRLYEMYMGPLEASKPWNTQDIIGPFRFLQRVWRMLIDDRTAALTLRAEADPEIERLLHRTIARVEGDIERLAYNTAIAAMIEFVNEVYRRDGVTRDQALRFCAILAPFAPHLAEELWSRLGGNGFVVTAPWPPFDPAMLEDDTLELPVQISGKVRGRIIVPAAATPAEVEAQALADPRVQELLAGLTVRKVIIVPGRIVNVIAG